MKYQAHPPIAAADAAAAAAVFILDTFAYLQTYTRVRPQAQTNEIARMHTSLCLLGHS